MAVPTQRVAAFQAAGWPRAAKTESKTKKARELSGINTLAKNKNLPEAPKEQSFFT